MRLDQLEKAVRELTRSTRQSAEMGIGDSVREIQRAVDESAGAHRLW